MDLGQVNWLATMALELAEQPDLAHTVDHILASAQASICSDAAGLLLVSDGGRVRTAAGTSEEARLADELQLECAEGPACDPSRDVNVHVVNNTRQSDLFPSWCPRVADLGFGAVLAVRLCTPGRMLGSLNLYSVAHDAFGDEARAFAELFGRHASIALVAAQQGETLRAAVSSRHVIGQAQGILMERYQVDATRAFEVLRRYSQHKNVKLRVIAEQVIARHQLPD